MTPIYKIEIDGNDITDKISPYFVSLRIQDKDGDEADSLELVWGDNTNLPLPPKGKQLYVWIGYQNEQTSKYGPYITDYAKQSGPPDQVSLIAHGADLRDQMKVKKTRHFDDITMSDLIATIATEYGLKPYISEDFADIVIPYLPQDNISDFVLLKKLANQYGARVKPENSKLTFVSKGLSIDSSKEHVDIKKSNCITYSVHLPDRYRYGSVKARYYDPDKAEYLSVKVGKDDPEQVLSNVFAAEQEALHAAKAEMRLIKNIQGQFWITLPLLPALRNETPITLAEFKKQISDIPWVATTVTHQINASGATTKVQGSIQPI